MCADLARHVQILVNEVTADAPVLTQLKQKDQFVIHSNRVDLVALRLCVPATLSSQWFLVQLSPSPTFVLFFFFTFFQAYVLRLGISVRLGLR